VFLARRFFCGNVAPCVADPAERRAGSAEFDGLPTRVVETRHAENGVKPISNMSINALFGGVPSFERELVDGMNETLSRIKAAAES
jgi:hypothetical protein